MIRACLFVCAFILCGFTSPVKSTVSSPVHSLVPSDIVTVDEPLPGILSWATTGSATSVGNYSYIARLNSTDVAVLDTVAGSLFTLRWGGSSFSQVGNTFLFSSIPDTVNAADGLVQLTSTRVVWIDHATNKLWAFQFDGTDWTQIGNAGTFVNISGNSNGGYLEDNSIVVWGGDGVAPGFQKITFDGTDFSAVGNIKATTASGFTAIIGLTTSRIAVVDSANDVIQTFDFDGSDWAQTGNSFAISPAIAGFYGSARLSDNEILFPSSNTQVSTLVFDETDWTLEGSASTLTGLNSWPRTIAPLSRTLVAYHSWTGATVRAAIATTD